MFPLSVRLFLAFFILGVVAAPLLPETNGKPLPETLSPALAD